MNKSSDFDIIASSRLWVGTPWNYSSSRWLRFKKDSVSDCCYGYGQTIFAVIKFNFQVLKNKTLRIDYLNSPPVEPTFKGFKPIKNDAFTEIRYQLSEKTSVFSHQITGKDLIYHWILKLDSSPFPKSINTPYKIPLEYFGYREC